MPEESALESGAGGLAKRLGHKVGPLPAWAWAAIPAAAYVIWSYYRASTAGDYVADDDLSPGNLTSEEEYLNTGGYPSVTGGYSGAPGGSSNLPTIPTPDYTNNDWSRDAIKWLTSQGVNALDATMAVNAYITGYPTTLNAAQRKALADVISAKGPAPAGGTIPPLTPTTPTTPTPPAPKPPTPYPTVPEAPTTVQARLLNKSTVRASWGLPQRHGTIIGFRVQQKQGTKIVHTKLALPTARSADFKVSKGWNTFVVSARNAKGWGATAYQSILVP